LSEDFKGYYEYLKSELDRYRGTYDEYIFYLPEIFKLLCDLLNEDIDKKYRLMISSALGYFVAPKDIIHEEVYGPKGFVDDLFLCCYVLDKVKKKYGPEFLSKHWEHSKDFEKVFNLAYKSSTKVVEDEKLKQKIFKYVGLV
jgi:uncharacterized membrane protein YkvA (DUF1232 family)